MGNGVRRAGNGGEARAGVHDKHGALAAVVPFFACRDRHLQTCDKEKKEERTAEDSRRKEAGKKTAPAGRAALRNGAFCGAVVPATRFFAGRGFGQRRVHNGALHGSCAAVRAVFQAKNARKSVDKSRHCNGGFLSALH